MKLHRVDSSNIDGIGFQENIQVAMNQKPVNVLQILFSHGQRYNFYNVPKEVFESFLKAESKGKFYHEHIKEVYQYEKTK